MGIFIEVRKRFQFGLISLENLTPDVFQNKDRESLWVEIVKDVFECYNQPTKQNILYLHTGWDK